MKIRTFWMILAVAAALDLASCGGTTTPPTTYTIGGAISGLTGTGLVLQDNAGDNLAVSAGATSFIFSTALVSGSNYAVTVLTQPSNPVQTCTVTSGGSGTANTSVVTVDIACANNTFTVGGGVSGLSGTGLVLQDNGGNNLPIGANGSFTFPTAASRGSNYTVTVLTQPSSPAQTCNVANGVGTNINGNVTDIQVTCYTTTVTYTIGGTVSGLSGTGLVLQDNSGDNLGISASGGFTFATPIASGSPYSVTVLTQPSTTGESCVVAGGGGTATANVTTIQVACSIDPYTIGGTISGLSGTGLVLQNNGGNSLTVSAGATNFTFSTELTSRSSYAVTVLTQPTGPSCSVKDSSGTVGNSNVTSVAINCSGNAINLSASVSGLLPNTTVVLQDNGGDNLSVSSNGIATNFDTPLASGTPYAVTVLTQPAGATCMVGAPSSGATASSNINVGVACGNPIATSDAHTCAVTSAGGVLCWGSNTYGQLGSGNTADSTSPVPVIGLSSGVVSLAAGDDSTCALTSAGNVWCWGDNAVGQLGNGTFTQSNTPVEVLDSAGNAPLGGVAAITAGQSHACAATGAGAAFCWGDNSEGELGNDGAVSFNIPVPVSGLATGTATISAGSYFTCAVTTSGAAMCWGKGGSGQLGNGNASGSAIPAPVLDAAGDAPLGGAVTISAGFEDACALTNTGTVLCWGANNSGQLGSGASGAESNIPVPVLNSTGESALNGVVAINAGHDDFCAVTGAGAALCWGLGDGGQLGNGKTINSATPAPVAGLSTGVAAIAAGYHNACALTTAGMALCWGQKQSGQSSATSTSIMSLPQ